MKLLGCIALLPLVSVGILAGIVWTGLEVGYVLGRLLVTQLGDDVREWKYQVKEPE